MSMNLYWQPVINTENDLSDALKFALRKRYQHGMDIRMDGGDLSYLQGLLDAGIEDAQTLIDAIEKHGVIRVYEQ